MTRDATAASSLAMARRLFAGFSAQIGLFAILLLLWIVFTSFAPAFISKFNVFTLTRTLAIDVVIGFSNMVVLAVGGMNLSIGSIGVCAVMAAGWMAQVLGLPIYLAALGGLILGGVLGWLNGIVIVRTGINSFIITLASASLFVGAMLIVTKAELFDNLPPAVAAIGKMRWDFVSVLLFVALVIAGLLIALYRYSVLGRQMLATGANPRAAAMSGIPAGRIIVMSHVLSGMLAASAGLMLMARVGAAMPSTGEDWLLPSFVAPVLGGTLLSGGFVSVIGTILGAALVTTIRSGVLLLQVGTFWLQLVLGAILLLAVMFDRYRGLYLERRSVGRQ